MRGRKVATPRQWQAIVAAKIGPCRLCCDPCSNGRLFGRIQFHYVVARDHGGDDVPDNIVPLCWTCSGRVTARDWLEAWELLESLTDAEYAYMVRRGGADYAERAYGVRYVRFTAGGKGSE